MSVQSSARVLAALLALGAPTAAWTARAQSAPAAPQALLAAQAFAPALRAAEALEAGFERERWRCEVLYRVRQFEPALEAAQAALRAQPGDLRMLQLGASCALWLQDGALAQAWCARFDAAISAQPAGAAATQFWSEQAAVLGESARQRVALERDLARRSARARSLALAVLGAATLALLGLGLQAARDSNTD